MRSANLLNDFAFKYVFGEDCKEANDALKSLLTVFLERKVVNVHVTNMGVDPLLETIVEFDDNTKMKLAIFINQNRLKLQYLSEFYLMKLYGSQEESDLNPCQAIAFYDGMESQFEINYQFRNDDGLLLLPDGMLKISVYSTQNLDKSYNQMNDKEKMVYYFLNCRDNGKTKIIENDEVIQTVEKRVETISDDCWTKWIEDFRIQQENELKLEFEEADKRLKEANKRLEEAQKRLEEANKKVQEANKRVDESDKLVDKMNQEMT
jgi:exonuclease VII small subunit